MTIISNKYSFVCFYDDNPFVKENFSMYQFNGVALFYSISCVCVLIYTQIVLDDSEYEGLRGELEALTLVFCSFERNVTTTNFSLKSLSGK